MPEVPAGPASIAQRLRRQWPSLSVQACVLVAVAAIGVDFRWSVWLLALAIAWAAYLVPKALRYHEDGARSRSIDGFSHRLRVLARREPVDAKRARLVVPTKTAPAAETRSEEHTSELQSH